MFALGQKKQTCAAHKPMSALCQKRTLPFVHSCFEPRNLSVEGYLTWRLSHVRVNERRVESEYLWTELTDI